MLVIRTIPDKKNKLDGQQPEVSITTLGSPYTQNFDTLPMAGTPVWTDNSTLAGWYAQYGGGSPPGAYNFGTGSSNIASLYSFGVAGTNPITDRALGSVAGGTPTNIFFAVQFTNNTGATVNSLDISFVGEQWRNSGNASVHQLEFQYRVAAAGVVVDANDPDTGWTDLNTLDFASPIVGGSATALDGNAPANRAAKSATLNVTISPGQEIWLRWADADDTSADHGLAIDDLSVTANNDTTPPDTTITGGPSGTVASTSATFTFTSTEAGSTFQCALDGAGFAACPAGYTGLSQASHTFQVRAIDAAGNIDTTPASRTWTVDTVDPDTSITGGPSGSVSSTSATFTFTSTEAGSTFQCALDGAGFAACPAGYTGLSQASHTFQVRAIDAAGNIDTTPASRTWTVDTVDPDTSITGGPSGSVSSTSATFTFTSTEAGSTFQCALDGAGFAACPAGYTGLSQASHTFQVRAIDAAGNIDTTPASRTWTVDTVDPDTSITGGPSGSVSSTSATFTFTSTEAGSTFQCALDGAGFAACPAGYTGLSQGSHTFQVRATDAAGNIDTTPASRTWTVDTVIPDTSITSGPSGTVSSTSATFTFTSTEAGSTFQCALDGAGFAACPAGYTGLSQGSHTFQVRATDAAGNTDQTPASRTWTVDTVIPDTSITSGPSGTVSSTSATFTFTSTEAGSSFQCSFDGAAFSNCPAGYTGLSQGSHTFQVRATDAAGNTDQTPASRTWTVDTVDPDTSITGGPSGTVFSTSASFTFSSTEAGSTFECRLDGAAFGACPAGYTGLSLGSHTFEVRATDQAGNTDQTPASRTWTVAAPAISTNDVTLNEGNAGTVSFVFTISLSNASNDTITVNFATANGTAAVADSDYQAASGTVTFAPGQTSQTVTVLINGDTKFEANETFTVNLSGGSGYTVASSDLSGVGTIMNDDSQPTISINDVTVTEGNSGTTAMTFTVSLSNQSGQSTTVNFATANGTATVADNDYQPASGTLTFAPGQTSQTVTVLVNGDTTPEADETFAINLSGASNATITDGTALGTIRNDDSTISINDVTLTEGNSGTVSFVFTVSLSNASSLPVTVNFATANGTATIADGDYLARSGSVTFAPGQTSQTVTVLINGDTKFETNETFSVTLSNPVNAAIADGTGVGTITNDDSQPTISINDVTVTEGNSGTTAMTFTVSLSNQSGQTTAVNFATANGTATVADNDYQVSSGTVTFSPGQTSQTVTVLINGDTKFETNETLTMNLSGAVNATLVDASGVGTITNDDATPNLSINDVSLTEGDSGTSTMTMTVSLSAASGATTTVDYATANGTATTANGDYMATSGTLTIPAGSTSGTIGITIIGDATIEADETFTVNLSGGSGYTAGDMQGQGTILNDDALLTLVVDTLTDDVNVNECTAAGDDCSLRGASSIANDGDTITFDPILFLPEAPPTIELAGEIVITQDITITGPGPAALTIQNTATASATSRIFQIDSGATVTISGLTLTGGNITTGHGGAISNSGNLAITNMVVTGNSAGATNAYGGGGIANQGTITITSSTIAGNAAMGGGGGLLMADGGTATINGSTFNANTSSGGGAILSQAISLPANLTITNSTISGNTGPPCSGVWNLGAMATATVTSSTITNNVAGNGSLCAFGPTTIRSTIVAGNQNIATDADTSGAFTSEGYNLIGNVGTATGFTGAGDQVGGGANPAINPMLAPLQNNGGPTQTHRPAPGFPGHDKGCSFGATTDQRGMPRVIDWPYINGSCDAADIGAFELLAPTAADATISGRVLTSAGRGISNVLVMVEDANGDRVGSATTNTFGFFTVRDLPSGTAYIVTVQSKRYRFDPSSQAIMLDDDVSGVDFTASP